MKRFRQSPTLAVGVGIPRFVILEASPSEAEAMNSGIHTSKSKQQSRRKTWREKPNRHQAKCYQALSVTALKRNVP
jgi:hypothetical protein